MFNTVENDLQSYLAYQKKVTRPGAGPGVWMTFLLPIALFASAATTEASNVYHLAVVLCLGFIGSSVSFLFRIHKTKTIIWSHYLSVVFVGCLLLTFNQRGIIVSIFGAVISTVVYEKLVLAILAACPKTLTYGEANVTIQALLLFIVTSVLQLHDGQLQVKDGCMQISTVILQVGLLGIFSICASVYMCSSLRKTAFFYALVGVIAIGGVVPILYALLQFNPVVWIIEFLTEDKSRIFLVIYWVICSVFAILAVAQQIKKGDQASTSVRKNFHILAVAVYIPGIIRDCAFLYLASGIVLALFIILEMMRTLQIYPLADALQEGFNVFADEKDAGALALTPIYLLVGCSLPLWIHPSPCIDCSSSGENTLLLLSGILSIGIGDTCASVFGSWLGKHTWKGTKKTIEGTAASITTQMIAILLLMYFGYVNYTPVILMMTIAAVVITSVIEAKTDQVDNLVLPLIMYILLLSSTLH